MSSEDEPNLPYHVAYRNWLECTSLGPLKVKRRGREVGREADELVGRKGALSLPRLCSHDRPARSPCKVI